MIESRVSENRKRQRYHAENLRIILKDDKNYKGERLKDISLGGVFVRMANPLPIGTRLALTLDPKLGLGTIKLEGEVVWVNTKDGDVDRGVGVRFLDVSSQVQDKFSKLFKTLRKK